MKLELVMVREDLVWKMWFGLWRRWMKLSLCMFNIFFLSLHIPNIIKSIGTTTEHQPTPSSLTTTATTTATTTTTTATTAATTTTATTAATTAATTIAITVATNAATTTATT
eukprot:226451_1